MPGINWRDPVCIFQLQISKFELQLVEGPSPFWLPGSGHFGDFGPELQRFEICGWKIFWKHEMANTAKGKFSLDAVNMCLLTINYSNYQIIKCTKHLFKIRDYYQI